LIKNERSTGDFLTTDKMWSSENALFASLFEGGLLKRTAKHHSKRIANSNLWKQAQMWKKKFLKG